MKILSSKQEARLEKKKKKMAALNEIIKLNENDRRKKSPELNGDDTSSCSESAEHTSAEPRRKRLKIEQDVKEKFVDEENESEKIIKDTQSSNIVFVENNIEIQKDSKERNSSSRYVPKIRLNTFGECASLKVDDNDRTPIFLTDIQHLVTLALLNNTSPCTPSRWCHLQKSYKVSHTVVLVLEGLSLFHYTLNEALFKESSILFQHKLEIVMPPLADGQIVDELITVPLSGSQQEKLIQKYGSLEAAMESTQNQTLLVKSVFPVKSAEPLESSKKDNDIEVVPRTQLLLSALQLVDEGYPLPLRGELANRYKDYVLTNDSYSAVTPTSPMFGLDCEMCRTSAGVNELTRISIINENYESVYETLVRPENNIVDYLTKYSGITNDMMLHVTKTLKEVQADVRNILPSDAILVGQSLQSDLVAMRMMHPYVIDTSVIFNISGDPRRKSKLQTLALQFLGEKIQDNPLGHDSIEDCSASLKLTKLKLSKGLDFGDAILGSRKRENDTRQYQSGDESSNVKRTAIISSLETSVDYQEVLVNGRIKNENNSINCYQTESNKYAIRKTREISKENALTITHIRILPKHMESSKINKTISKVDRWISSVWDSTEPNGLFIVMLGGTLDVSNGVVMLKIKKI